MTQDIISEPKKKNEKPKQKERKTKSGNTVTQT